jgi:hypothetical protein
VNLANEKKIVLSDRYRNKVNIVSLKYLYQLRGCVRPLRIVPRKNICFVLLAWSCFRYSAPVFTIFVQFLSFTKKTGSAAVSPFSLLHLFAKLEARWGIGDR